MELSKISKEYYELNPSNKVDSLNDIDAPMQSEITPELDESVSSIDQSELIKRVFENKSKSLLTPFSGKKFKKGGSINTKKDQEVWSAYDFLHKLLPKVFGKKYILSDAEAIKITKEIQKEELELKEYSDSLISKEGVDSVFKLSVESFDKVSEKRKALDHKRTFISERELEAYVLTNPELPSENYVKKITSDKEDLMDEGLIMLDMSSGKAKWVYRYIYLSGDIQRKISDMNRNKSVYLRNMSENQFESQLKALNDSRNNIARITYEGQNKIYINPSSDFANDIEQFTIQMDDWRFYTKAYRDMDMASAFKEWLKSDEVDPDDFKVTESPRQVIDYYVEGIEPKMGDDRVNINLKQNAQLDGDRLFERFLNDALTDDCKQRLEAIWNAKYNNLVLPKLYKIPVALSISKTFKNGVEFIPNPSQIEAIQFEINANSGLLAHGVGLGKTASSIMAVSYAIDNNLSKYPTFVVPNPTFEKWVREIEGGYVTNYEVKFQDSNGETKVKIFNERSDANDFKKEFGGTIKPIEKFIQGLLPHLPNVVGLYNLNVEIVKNELKDYSEYDLKKMSDMQELRSYLASFSVQTDMSKVDATIKKLYPEYNFDNLLVEYNLYADRFTPDFDGKTVASKGERRKTMFEYFRDKIYSINRSLPFELGEIKSFPENTIFVLTYEGLNKLGLETEDQQMSSSVNKDYSALGVIFKELSQGDSLSMVTERGKSVLANKISESMFGSEFNPKIYSKDLKIDYAVFDESHNFKKLFTQSKGKPEHEDDYRVDGLLARKKSKYDIGKGGQPSSRALSAYILVRSIQFENNNGNVLHLTATPFTNDPIEVYSMLALTNYQRLVDAGFRWIEDFFDVFMKISFDIRYTASQTIKKEQVLTGYNNTPQMRSLIFFLMDYKSGDETNIKRPTKFILPNYNEGLETVLPAHPDQESIFKKVKDYIKGDLDMADLCQVGTEEVDVENLSDEKVVEIIIEDGTNIQRDKFARLELPLSESQRKDAVKTAQKIVDKHATEAFVAVDEEEADAVRVLKGLSFLRQATLSPYLFNCRSIGDGEPNYKEYVETSPKLLYSVLAAKSTNDYERKNGLRLSGSVIYMNIGVNPTVVTYENGEKVVKKWSQGGFEKIKEYLVKELAYKEGEVSIVKGGMSAIAKEREKNKFLAGDSLVMIGSSSISTGIDLQNNGSSLINNSFDWNPTDNDQIIGRIWRQGNRFDKVRLAYPMIENSADPVMFQILQEKTLRIKEIWDKDGRTSKIDLRDFNPKEFKKKLITDPDDRAQYWYEENVKELEDETIMLENRLQSLGNAANDYQILESYRMPVKAMLTVIDAFRKFEKSKEAVEVYDDRLDAIHEKYKGNPKKLTEELKKFTKDAYDHRKDPDGRYIPKDFFDASDEEVFKNIINWISNSGSWWRENESYELVQNLNGFIYDNYPDYYEGKWVSDDVIKSHLNESEELEKKIINLGTTIAQLNKDLEAIMFKHDWIAEKYKDDSEYNSLLTTIENQKTALDSLKSEKNALQIKLNVNKEGGIPVKFSHLGYKNGIVYHANEWKNAKKVYDKHKDRLSMMGISFDNLDAAKDMIRTRITEISKEIGNISSKKSEMREKFVQEEMENRSIAPTVSERIEEFTKLNPDFLDADEQLPTFSDDREPVAKKVTPTEIKKTSVKTDKEDQPSTMDENDFLKEKIEAFEMMLEMEDDQDEIDFLKDKIEAFEMMLDAELV